MTRETKIGLLVGLAFIIVIGILLSDHWNSSNEPPQAQVDDIGSNVRGGVGSPAAPRDPPVTSVAAVVQTPPAHGGMQVRTPAELKPPISPADPRELAMLNQGTGNGAPVEQVYVGPATPPRPAGGRLPMAPVAVAPSRSTQPQPQQPFVAAPRPDRGADEVFGVPPTLQELAAQNGLELVPADGPNAGNGNTTAQPAQPSTPGLRPYKVQPGDSLSRMAARLMGADTKTNREAIIRVNASLRQNPDLLIVGRTYNIPVGPGAAIATPPERRPQQPEPVRAEHRPSDWTRLVPESTAEPAQRPAGRPLYTVKAKDSLWRIAADQLGDGNAWTEIRDLNKDVLKGGDAVREGMKLRLPTRSVAAAG